jgi:hypothetical protein
VNRETETIHSEEHSASRRRFLKTAGAAGLATCAGSLFAASPAISMYQHAPNQDAIQAAVIGGRQCWRMTVWNKLRENSVQFGGTVHWGERAQWLEDRGLGLTSSIRHMAVYVPSNTVIRKTWIMFAGLHSRNLPNGVWAIYALEDPDVFRCIVAVRNPDGSWREVLQKDQRYFRDQWYDITFQQDLGDVQDFQVQIDGSPYVSYQGRLLMRGQQGLPDEAIYSGGNGPYLEYGPYPISTVANRRAALPESAQTIFMQCGSTNKALS